MATEVERIADLEAEGYQEGRKPCPICGTFLMFKDHEYEVVMAGVIAETIVECPSCGYYTVYYDAE